MIPAPCVRVVVAWSSEGTKKLLDAATDLFELAGLFADNAAVSGMSSYKLMARVLDEQCEVKPGEEGPAQVSVKPPKKVPSDSLQNPSDPDAGYDGHKGQGYQVQVDVVLLSDRVAFWSEKPARIKKVVEIDLPRPRATDTDGKVALVRQAGEFAQYLQSHNGPL